MPDLDDLWNDAQNEMIADRLADDHESGRHDGEPDPRCGDCGWLDHMARMVVGFTQKGLSGTDRCDNCKRVGEMYMFYEPTEDGQRVVVIGEDPSVRITTTVGWAFCSLDCEQAFFRHREAQIKARR